MRKVKLSFNIQYIECDLAPKFAEHNPKLYLYLDGHFKRTLVELPLDENDLSKTYNGQVNGLVAHRIGDLSSTTSFCIASSALRKIEGPGKSIELPQDAGVTHVRLKDIQDGLETNGFFQAHLNLELKVTRSLGKSNSPGLIKGKLLFRVEKAGLETNGVQFRDVQALSAPVGETAQSMVNYIQSTMQIETQMGNTIPGTDRVRVPFDYSESGVAWCEVEKDYSSYIGDSVSGASVPLPAAAYVKFETPETNLSFWENALDTVLARDNMTIHDYARMDPDQKARTMVLVNVYLTQYFDYVGDTVDRNNRHEKYQARLREGYENFGDPLVFWSGDCEDDSTGIMQTLSAFQRFPFEKGTPLHELQNISSHYIPFMSLDVVHGQKTGDDPNAPKGAHMNVNFLPQDYVRQSMSRTQAGRSILSRLPWDEPKDFHGHGFPVIIGEGTGMYEPLGYVDTMLPIRKYVYQAPSLSYFKKPITHERGSDSTFFLGSLNGFTPYFFDRGSNVSGFWYATTQGQNRATRGIYYKDMVNSSTRLAMVPQPPIPRNIMATINETTLLRIPPKPLVLNNVNVPTQNTHLEKLVKAVEDQNRSTGPENRRVPVYMRPHQINDQITNDMIQDMTQLKQVWKVDYTLERITDELYGYRVMFYVN